MFGDKIDELNRALPIVPSELLKDELAASRVEVAIVTCGGGVHVVQDFKPPSKLTMPELVASGDTPLGAALLKAYDISDEQHARYEASDLDSYERWIVAITDSEATDSPEVIASTIQRIREGEGRQRGKRILFHAVGVEGANMEKLAQFSKRPPLKLRGLQFSQLFRWVSASLKRVTQSQVGDKVFVPDPKGYGLVGL